MLFNFNVVKFSKYISRVANMGDLDILTPLINSQDSLCSQDKILTLQNENAWGHLYPENKNLKIEGLYFYQNV